MLARTRNAVIALTVLTAAPAMAQTPGWALTTHPHHTHRIHHHHHPHLGYGGGATVCSRTGGCSSVAGQLVGAFQAAINEFEALGYAVGTPGCLSAGHMAHSKHHSGAACDLFNQVARNRTALRQPPPAVQIAVAARHGLTSGCEWRHPDCGHIEQRTAYHAWRRSYALAP